RQRRRLQLPNHCISGVRPLPPSAMKRSIRALTKGSGTEPSSAASVLAKFLLEPRAVGPEKVLYRVKLKCEWDISAIPKLRLLQKSYQLLPWHVIKPSMRRMIAPP